MDSCNKQNNDHSLIVNNTIFLEEFKPFFAANNLDLQNNDGWIALKMACLFSKSLNTNKLIEETDLTQNNEAHTSLIKICEFFDSSDFLMQNIQGHNALMLACQYFDTLKTE